MPKQEERRKSADSLNLIISIPVLELNFCC